ncbi:MAG: Type 1 glutamine amidotransferase-like domain-containing protein [Patescibacteria group bacterium]
MKKLYLTSSKLGGLLDLLSDSPKQTNLAFIPTAGDPYKDHSFVDEDRMKLIDEGFKVQDVDLKGIQTDELRKKFKGIDVVYVAGGNTFYLLEKVLESGFDVVIKELIDKGVIYAGGSAGAVLAGPTIEPVDAFDDPKAAPHLKSYAGLGLVDFIVLPHYKSDPKYEAIQEKIIRDWSDKGYKVIPLTNGQAIRVIDDSYKIIDV